MAVRIRVGRAGSGKSKGCFEEIVSELKSDPLGRPIFLIVPKTETFTRQRELTCASGLNGFCRAQIVSFETLGEQILSECGNAAMPQVTALGRQMIIGHLLRLLADKLKFYSSTARQPGLATQLDALFEELERCGNPTQDLPGLLERIEAGGTDAALHAKCHDLSLLYQHYIQYLGQDRLDPHRRLQRVLGCIRHASCLRAALVYIDNFLDFTQHERQMIAALAKVTPSLCITLLVDPKSRVLDQPERPSDELELFARTESTFRNLVRSLNADGLAWTIERLEPIDRFAHASLAELERQLCSMKQKPQGSVDGIELIEALDRRCEVEAAARKIKALAESGVRYRDILVLARRIDDYGELIAAAFSEHDVPYFIDRRRAAAHHPLIQFTRALIYIGLHNWPHEAVMTLLKTELAGVKRDEADELENYVLLHRITAGGWTDPQPWGFSRRRREADDESVRLQRSADAERINALRRRCVDPLLPLIRLLNGPAKHTALNFATELFETFRRCGADKTLWEWIAAAELTEQIEQRDEHTQAWNKLIGLLDELVDVIGDSELSGAEFANVLETGLERLDLALAPPTVDTVIAGSIERARGNRPAAVIVLGMTDAQFPRPDSTDSLLSEFDRRALEQANVQLDDTAARRMLNERLLAYLALTRGSTSLCLMRALHDDEQRPVGPSSFWRVVSNLFPRLVPQQIFDPSAISVIGTQRQLAVALMAWVRRGAADDEWSAIYDWFAGTTQSAGATDVARLRSWKALLYDNTARLASVTAEHLNPDPLIASVSRIETFAACPYKHFVRYGLKLTEREEDQITAVDLGNAYHTMLEGLVRDMIDTRIDWQALPPERIKLTISHIAEAVGRELRGELMLGSARNRFTLKSIERTVDQVMRAQTIAGQRGQMEPWQTELVFDSGRGQVGSLELQTPAGRHVLLRGRIDRIDRVPGKALFAVYDYKLSGKPLSLQRVFHGLALQLLTYMTVVQRNATDLAGGALEPAAALYVQLLRRLKLVQHPRAALAPEDPDFDLQVKPRGLVDQQFLPAMDRALSPGQSSAVLQVKLKQDGTLAKNSDASTSQELDALLSLTERKLAELADQIISGRIEVQPFKLGKETACSNCTYRSICRFDRSVNRYLNLHTMTREQVIDAALAKGAR